MAVLGSRRARSHILEDATASVQALDGVPIDVLLLHAPDPRVTIATSARALARAQEAGLARSVGVSQRVSQATRGGVGEAPIAAVEIALGAYDDLAIRSGVVGFCIERGIEVLAHSPLGGPERARRLARDPELVRIAASLQASPIEVFLAYLLAVGPRSCRSSVRVAWRRPPASRVQPSSCSMQISSRRWTHGFLSLGRTRRPPPDAPLASGGPEVVLLMGVPGSGKSRAAQAYVERGYERLNRDWRAER